MAKPAQAQRERNQRVRDTITREFGQLLQIVDRTKDGGTVTRGELLRAETQIKMALNGKDPKTIMCDRALEPSLVGV